MAIILGYANVYRSGYFHRKGKPNMYDRHFGDIYPDREAALADLLARMNSEPPRPTGELPAFTTLTALSTWRYYHPQVRRHAP